MSCTQSARLVPIGQAAKLANVHVDTIRYYASRGDIEFVTTPGGHRRVNLASVAECFGVPFGTEDITQEENDGGARVTVLWGRVSTSKQRQSGDLQRQLDDLRRYAAEHCQGERLKFIQGVGSGINLERPELLQLISLVVEGRVSKIVCTFQERLMRTGLALLKHLCKINHVEIVEIGELGSDREKTLEDDMVASVLAIMNVFVAKKNGIRGGARTKTILPEGFRDYVCQLAGAGLSLRAIVAKVEKRNYRCVNTAKPLGFRATRAILEEVRRTAPVVPGTVRLFIKRRCTIGAGKQCPSGELYAAYCEVAGEEALNRDKFTSFLKQAVPHCELDGSNGKFTVARGVALKAGRPA